MVETARNLELTVQADAQLNTDSRNRSAPLVIRIYSLKTSGAFQSTDFFTLFERDQAILGADLIAKEEIQLRPGESRRIVRELPSGARILGVIGAYRELEKSNWRASYSLPEPAIVTNQASAKAVTVPVRISLGAREIRVTAQ